ncbi:tyrosine-type recombinase/integrase [Erysipelothrix sp. D19-032]
MKSGFGEIVIRDRIRKELQAYAIEKGIESGPIFILKDYQVRYRLKVLSSKSRLQKDKFHPHAFRHFFAIQFMRQGGDIEVLRQILGHARYKDDCHLFKPNQGEYTQARSIQ